MNCTFRLPQPTLLRVWPVESEGDLLAHRQWTELAHEGDRTYLSPVGFDLGRLLASLHLASVTGPDATPPKPLRRLQDVASELEPAARRALAVVLDAGHQHPSAVHGSPSLASVHLPRSGSPASPCLLGPRQWHCAPAGFDLGYLLADIGDAAWLTDRGDPALLDMGRHVKLGYESAAGALDSSFWQVVTAAAQLRLVYRREQLSRRMADSSAHRSRLTDLAWTIESPSSPLGMFLHGQPANSSVHPSLNQYKLLR